MKELNPEIDEQIQDVLFDSTDLYNDGETLVCIQMLKDGLKLLPGSPVEYDLGYSLVNEICEKAYHQGFIEIVDEWIDLYIECDQALRGYGNSEYLVGRLAFERGEFDKAKEAFVIADKKSNGRIWAHDKEMKYTLFFKKK